VADVERELALTRVRRRPQGGDATCDSQPSTKHASDFRQFPRRVLVRFVRQNPQLIRQAGQEPYDLQIEIGGQEQIGSFVRGAVFRLNQLLQDVVESLLQPRSQAVPIPTRKLRQMREVPSYQLIRPVDHDQLFRFCHFLHRARPYGPRRKKEKEGK
jgi:hypothetical protein